jgi:Sensors of blue-light using FAD
MTQSSRKLFRLFYRSRQTPGAAADLDFVVQQIIGVAIRRNREVGLSGLLLTVQGHFVQALEGNVDAVRATYARISMDPRHRDLHIISQGLVETRLFSVSGVCALAHSHLPKRRSLTCSMKKAASTPWPLQPPASSAF